MVGLLLLKQLSNLSAKRVVEQWTLNPYRSSSAASRSFRGARRARLASRCTFVAVSGPSERRSGSASGALDHLHGAQSEEKEIVLDTVA